MEQVNPETLGLNAAQLARIGEHLRDRYIQPGKLPGSITLIARYGRVGLLDVAGLSDLERDTPMSENTIFRIYSMSKPITSVALMMLYERGLFSLEDPVHRFIPEWRNLAVRTAGAFPLFATAPCERPMTIRDLLRHTSGLTYDFLRESNLDYAYRKLQVANPAPGYTLKHMIEQLAQLPLEFSPGTRWNYSVATDVLGYLIEVISGQSLPVYLQEHLFGPLGMVDTAFNITPDKVQRLASCYERDAAKKLVCNDDGQASQFRDRVFYSGGGGLLSTVGDYFRFCQMLLQGGTLDGVRILGSRTLDYMTANHLPGDVDLEQYAMGSFSETEYEGVGFGLGFANKMDPVKNGNLASLGSFFWGGLASTLFWVDPEEELVVIFMTQLMPSSTFNLRGQLESMVYAALD
ncbi:MAG TPA: serine hydrolase [Halieaceae bacterium]|jgi:CubicO group peptidase (beta-lactamase class C family)|uniref:serine hydrolase domain-containing protein n=1 Tax=Haliea TaxID=475794 RepID=UPI000C3D55B2|nr:serine hydrolase domain-containing protein [Haliea sp.]HAN69087.1 serine hydrolase [Halieaceae bacterium]MAD62381.1 serine hydrolase [Haliea sp.]MAY91370.1 serine hydrolase [Haliea sp.]MBK41096.1 serine hydrolase [Haliea sp.]MBP71116.1 serine hydrolase [Haliea sp.]|tara:strand:+ start:3008 stop:4225 length:1218 start_codon:yes stop_codon:yes gene_type:complete